MSRRALGLALAVLAVEAAGAIWLVYTSDQVENRGAAVALALTAGVTFVLSGVLALSRRPDNRTGVYLAAVGYLWLLGSLSESDDRWVFAAGLLVGSLIFVPFVALVLAYPTGVLEARFDRWFPFATGVVLAGTSFLLLLFARYPGIDCDGCPSSPILISDQPGVTDALTVLFRILAVTLGVLLIAVLVRRWRAASPVQRRVLMPVLATGAAVIGLVVAETAAEQFSERVAGVLGVAFLLAFAAVPIAFLFGILRTRLARSSVTELLVALSEGRPLRDALADALRDPSLEVAYWAESRGGWIDSAGRSVPEPETTATRKATTVERDGRPVAVLVHDPLLSEDPALVDAVARAAAITLDNERLQAELLAQYTLLETIVDTAPSLLSNVDTDGRLVNFNKAVEEASGLADPEELRGRFFWDVFMDSDEREAMIARFHEAAPDYEPSEYENVFTNARGERRAIAWKTAPVTDETGVVRSIVAGGLDITDRHRHAEELERERAFLNAIANNAPSLLCLIDDQGVVQELATNIAFERLLDYRPEETGGHIFWERYIAPADVDDVRAEIERVIAGGAPRELDSRWVSRRGRRIAVAWSCTPLPRLDERTIFLISGVDVTERQRRELEVRTSEARLRAAIDSSPVAIVEVDLDEHVAAWNPAAERIFGWSAEEVLGMPVPIVTAGLREEFQELSTRARAGEVISGHETLRARKDGSLINVAIAAAPIRDAAGEVVAYMALYADISMRKSRERELEHERDFLSTTANSIPSLLAVLDEDGLVTERGVNRAFMRVMGYEESELIGRSLWRIVGSPADRASLVAVYREAVARGVAHGGENRWVAKGGETHLVEWTSIPVVDARLGQCYLISATDVTERKQQEAEIRASRARIVQAEDAARRGLERNLHDGAQQRLVSLSLQLRLAEARLADSPAEAAAIISRARDELTHALDELRELARGIHPAVLTDRGLAAAVDALIARAPLPVEFTHLPERLPADAEAAAYYVVSEALANVAKYADASVARVSISKSNGRVVIDVDDDGVGGADPDNGSGLRGLADRVAALDGSLSVASPVGGGTRIRAEIPLPAAPAE